MTVCVEAEDGTPALLLAVSQRAPRSECVATSGEWLTAALGGESAARLGTHARCWLAGCVQLSAAGCSAGAAHAALRLVFEMLPDVDAVLACVDAVGARELPEGGLFALYDEEVEGSTSSVSAKLYACERALVLPRLAVRQARVEDHDDLAPQLARAAAGGAAVESVGAAEVASGRDDEPFVLARVIEDPAHVVLVGVDSVVGGAAQGLCAVTAMPDAEVETLAEHFDLEAYDNLCDMRAVPRPEEDIARDVEAVREERARERAAAEAAAARAAEAAAKAAEEAGEGEAGAAAEAEGEGAEAEAEAALEAEAEAEEEAPIEVPLTYDTMRPCAFRLWLYSLSEGFASRGLDFLPEAFAHMPEATYGVVTLPREAPVSTLVARYFTRVPPRPAAAPDFALFIVHRHALLPSFGVRLGDAERDAGEVAALVEGFPEAEVLVASFAAKAREGRAVAAECDGQLVGLVTMRERVPAAQLGGAFDLRPVLDVARHPATGHALLEQVVLNPIFAPRRAHLMAEAMELLGASALYLGVPPGEALPDVCAENMVQCAPLRAVQPGAPASRALADSQMAFALFSATQRSLTQPRTVSNARVVVVGASDAALAALGRLLLSRRVVHADVTVVAPGDVPTDANPTTYQFGPALLARHGIEGQVTVVDGEVKALDVEHRRLELDWLTLPYEYLVLAPALTDVSASGMGLEGARGVVPADGVPGLLAFAAHAKATAIALAAEARAAEQAAGEAVAARETAAGEAVAARAAADEAAREREAAAAEADEDGEAVDPETQSAAEEAGPSAQELAAQAAERTAGEAAEAHDNASAAATEAVAAAAEASASAQWQPESAERVVVYGSALAAYCAAQTLLDAGVRGEVVTLVVPPGATAGLGDARAEALVHEAAVQAGVRVEVDTTVASVSAPDNAVASVTLERAIFDGQAASTLDCSLLVLAGEPGVDTALFGAINASGVVYNGRIVVGADFETSAACVFAGGDAAGFGRRLGDRPPFACCSPVEVGEALAACVERAVLGVGSGMGGGAETDAPRLGAPRVEGGALPGGLHYCRAALPHVWARRGGGLVAPPGLRSLTTEAPKAGYMRLDIDGNGLVEGLTYCGRAPPEGAALARVVGLNVAFLGGLVAKYDAGEVSDLLGYLRQPWMAALFEDSFRGVLDQIRAAMPWGGDMSPEERLESGKMVVQGEVLRLIKERTATLPIYPGLPAYA